MNIASANEQGHVDYQRDNFVRLNPDVLNTVENWYVWMQETSKAHLEAVRKEIHFEVQREEKPF